METNSSFLTAGDLALWESRKDDCHRHRGKGTAITGLAIGCGALAVAVAGILGVNAASKARSETAKAMSDGNTKAIDLVAQTLSDEKVRSNGINLDITQSLRSLSSAQGTGTGSANALSTAEALAYAQAVNSNSGLGSAIGGCNFLRVARYSAPSPCPCDSCGN